MKIFTILLLLLSAASSAQIIQDGAFAAFCKKLTVPKTYNFTSTESNNVTQRLTYLGEIASAKKETYKVLVSFVNLSAKGLTN